MAWNGSNQKEEVHLTKRRGTKSPQRGTFLVVGGIALLFALGAGIWMVLRPHASRVPENAPAPAIEQPALIESVKPKIESNASTESKEPEKQEKTNEVTFVKRPGALQLPDGRILTFPAPNEGEIRRVYSHGHLYECDHLGNFKDVTPRKLFNTAFEGNFLALAVEGKSFIPAFLTGLDPSEVRDYLTRERPPIGDETEEEKEQLKAYDAMRRAALQYMDEGGSFDEFVMDFANYERKSREANAMCLREVMTLYKQGRLREAKEMVQAANALMTQKGLRPFRLPPHVKAALGEGEQ